MNEQDIQSNSRGWLLYVKTAFACAIAAIAAGILFMPGGLLVQGYFAISALFLVSTTITLSKTMRDEHESLRLLNKISDARTNKILREYAE